MGNGKQCPECGFLVITFGSNAPEKCPQCGKKLVTKGETKNGKGNNPEQSKN